ncbi:MAG: hypothetical protein QM790_03165 [Nibricoccus sp.]
MPDRFLNPQFYAEDGLWYTEFLKLGWNSFVTHYGGYLLTADRLVALVAVQVPLRYAPALMNIAALIFTLCVAGRLLSSRNPLPYKPWIAFVLVLLPYLDDTLMTITNIQWVLAVGLVMLMISDDAENLSSRWYDYIYILVAGLTGVHCVLLFPLFAARLAVRKSRESGILLALIAVTACIQAWFVLHAPALTPNNPVPFSATSIPAVLGYRIFLQPFAGAWTIGPGPVGLLSTCGFIVVALFLLLGIDPKRDNLKSPTVFLTAAAFVYIAASLFRFKAMLPMFLSPEGLSRYFYVPQILLVWLLIARMRDRTWRSAISAVLLAALAASTFSLFRATPLIDYRWSEEVRSLKPDQPAAIPINPKGWVFQLPPPNRQNH